MRVADDPGNVLGASPAEGDARPSVPVVVHDADARGVSRALFQPDLRASGRKPTTCSTISASARPGTMLVTGR